jgi:hypothetical protein
MFLLHFIPFLTEMMFSSLFQHFGKRERERVGERFVHFQRTMSPQFMSLPTTSAEKAVAKRSSTFNKARKAT